MKLRLDKCHCCNLLTVQLPKLMDITLLKHKLDLAIEHIFSTYGLSSNDWTTGYILKVPLIQIFWCN